MQTYDIAPRLFRQFENRLASSARTDYNLQQTAENNYRITFAVPGFTQDEIGIESYENTLWVSGSEAADAETTEYLYQGLPKREFKRQFYLPDHVKVTGATLENGLLYVDLVREIPETLKPRKIEVNAAPAAVLKDAAPKAA